MIIVQFNCRGDLIAKLDGDLWYRRVNYKVAGRGTLTLKVPVVAKKTPIQRVLYTSEITGMKHALR